MRAIRLLSVVCAVWLASLSSLITPLRAQAPPGFENAGTGSSSPGGYAPGKINLSEIAGDDWGVGEDPGGPTITVEAVFTAPSDTGPARLFVTATITENWYTYSMKQRGGPKPARIEVTPSKRYKVGEFRPSLPPKEKNDPGFGKVETHQGRVTWHAPLDLSNAGDLADMTISGELWAQLCDKGTCLPTRAFPFTAKFSRTAPIAVTESPVEPPADVDFDLDRLEIVEEVDVRDTSILGAMLLGFLGGLILNLMPCVLPVIGLKVLAFVEQSGESRSRGLMLNIWYSLGLMSVFILLAALAAFMKLGWGQLFTYEGFNIALAAVVFVMGLSFLGVWEIPIPGFVGSGKTAQLAQKEGASGAFAKGVLTTILATPCSGPFLASALFWAVSQPPANTFAVFISVGLGMASPYLLIGAFPALIRFLPKPGAWMDTFKQIMGFVLLATVVYIFTFINWPYMVPTLGLLFGLWAACWWIGRTPLTADLATKSRAWLEAIAFAGAVWILMFPGLTRIVPGGYGFRGMAEVMNARYRGLGWQPFTEQGLKAEVEANKTVLVDFTADWCLTCKTLESVVLNSSAVQAKIEANGVVTMKADWTDGEEAVEVDAMLGRLGSKQVPQLAIFPAGDPNNVIVLRGTYTRGQLIEALQKAGKSQP